MRYYLIFDHGGVLDGEMIMGAPAENDLVLGNVGDGILNVLKGGVFFVKTLIKLVQAYDYQIVFHSKNREVDQLRILKQLQKACRTKGLTFPKVTVMAVYDTHQFKNFFPSAPRIIRDRAHGITVVGYGYDKDGKSCVRQALSAALDISEDERGQHIVFDDGISVVNAAREEGYQAYLIGNGENAYSLTVAIEHVLDAAQANQVSTTFGYEVFLSKKRVKLDNDTRRIFSALRRAFIDAGFSVMPLVNDDKQVGRAVNYLTNIVNEPLNGPTCILDEIKIAIDPEALMLRDAYIHFLNRLMQIEKLGAKNTESRTIYLKFVLVRELLLRLVTLALCGDVVSSHERHGLLRVAQLFGQALTSSDVCDALYHRYESPSVSFWGLPVGGFEDEFSAQDGLEPTLFVTALRKDHARWITCLQERFATADAIDRDSVTMKEVFNYLMKRKRAIVQHIVVELAPDVPIEHLSENWLQRAIADYERQFLKERGEVTKKMSKFLGSYDLDGQAWKRSSAWQAKIIHYLVNGGRTKIMTLYPLLAETNTLLKITVECHRVLNTIGWASLATGVLRLDNFGMLLNAYRERCHQILSVTKGDSILVKLRDKTLTGDHSVKHFTFTAIDLQFAKNIISLDESNLLRRLGDNIAMPLQGLWHLQKDMKCPILEWKQLEQWVDIPIHVNERDANQTGFIGAARISEEAQYRENDDHESTFFSPHI